MPRPSLVRWTAYWFRTGVIIFGLFALGLAIANVADGLSYWLALRRARRLDAQQLQRLAAACSRYEEKGHQRLKGADIPPEFRMLRPERVSISRGCTDIAFFERDDFRYVFLRVDTYPENQTIRCVSAEVGPQHSQTLWARDPRQLQEIEPHDRLVTVWESNMHAAREWIVRPEELLVVDHPYTTGSGPHKAARFSLQVSRRKKIGDAVAAIDSAIRGHRFDAGSCDGIELEISFSTDGKTDDSSIWLHDTWRDELRPLIDAINQAADSHSAIGYPEMIRKMNEQLEEYGGVGGPRIVVTSSHDFQSAIAHPPLPWWCFWPRFVDYP